jgi:hypothetical protein
MFGSHNIPLTIEKDGIFLSIEREKVMMYYRRASLDTKIEKIILAIGGKIIINPIEPLNVPKKITTNLLIEFKKSVMIEPKAKRKIYLTFPVEIGIFMSGNEFFDIIDIFSLIKPKFTLYGDPRNGIISKYYSSEVFSSIPSVNPLYEGVLELKITNTTSKWIEVTRAVFDAYGMKLYYDDTLVSMKAAMTLEKDVAETDFIDSPIKEGMNKALEYFTAKKIPVLTTKFVMEYGV